MRKEEEKHIRDNNYFLINNTDVTINLLRSLNGYFSPTDIQTLTNPRNYDNKVEQADAFYQLAIKKKDIFNPLIEALKNESQIEPADVLAQLPEDLRQQPKPSNVPSNVPPAPQRSGNQPQTSNQNQSVASGAPISQGQASAAQPNQETLSGIEELMEKLELDEDEIGRLLDFKRDKTPLDVVVQKPEGGFLFSSLNYKENPYNLPPDSKGIKGLALVLNIIEFKNPNLGSREAGAELDMEYMTDLWNQLGYKIHPLSKKDREKKLKTKDDIMRMIEEFKTACKKQLPKSIVVFIGSHGGWNKICTSDPPDADGNPVFLKLYEDIVDQFNAEICPSLANKPKIFLVQTCQDHIRNEKDNIAPNFYISDTIVCAAQVPGFTASRDKYKGSWFVYCLTWVFKEKAHKCTLREMLDMVKLMMRNIQSTATTGQIVAINDVGMPEKLSFYLDP